MTGADQPETCTMRLRREGNPAPKTGCMHCSDGDRAGCPFERDRSLTHDADGRKRIVLNEAVPKRRTVPSTEEVPSLRRALDKLGISTCPMPNGEWTIHQVRPLYDATPLASLASTSLAQRDATIAAMRADLALQLGNVAISQAELKVARDRFEADKQRGNRYRDKLRARINALVEALEPFAASAEVRLRLDGSRAPCISDKQWALAARVLKPADPKELQNSGERIREAAVLKGIGDGGGG